MSVTSQQIDEIISAAAEMDLFLNDDEGEGATLTPYSGRFMYGRSCLSLITNKGVGDLVLFTLAVNRVDEGLALELSVDARSDNMGQGVVYYWPDLEMESAEEQD